MTKIKNKSGDITTITNEKKIIKDYDEQLYANELNNLE